MVTSDYKGLPEVTRDEKGLEWVTTRHKVTMLAAQNKCCFLLKSKQEFVVYYRNEKCYKLFEGNILTG